MTRCRGFVVAVLLYVAFAARVPSVRADNLETDLLDRTADITVTARRLAEDPRKIPVAVTVMSGNEVDALNINSAVDLNRIPGLTDAPIGTRNNVSFSIRGQGTAYAGQPGVIPYFGEVPNFPLTFFDLQNVQVLKGPQGTLFGQTSTGGVLLFEPKRPGDTFEGSLDVQAGNHDYNRLRGVLNVPIIPGQLAVRVAGEFRYRHGWSTGIYSNPTWSRADLNNIDDDLFRVAMTWRPLQHLEIYSLFAQDDRRTQGTSSVLYYADPRFMSPAVRNVSPASVATIAAGWRFWTGYSPPAGQSFAQLLETALDQQLALGPLSSQTDFNQRNTTINRGAINQINWDVAKGLRIRSIFGLRWQTIRGANSELDGSNLPLDDFECRYVPGALNASGPCATTGGWPSRTLSEELQVQGANLQGRLQWQTGAFYSRGGVRQFTENTQPVVLFGSLNADPASTAFCSSVAVAWPCASMAKSIIQSKALFGQATVEVVTGVHLTAGYRDTWDYTRTDTSAKSSYRVPFAGQLLTLPVYGETVSAGAKTLSTEIDLPANYSYNVSADWQVSKNQFLYIAHRSGYKTGGINATANPGTPQRTYGPERAKDLEVGTKADWVFGSARATLNADVYHTWYSNIQEGQIIPGTASTVTSNIANAGITGLELDGNIIPRPWVQLGLSVAYTDARYTNWTETSSCGSQYWRPQCAGLASSTVIQIDHALGQIQLPGTTIPFTPDRFLNTSRWQWAFEPALLLKPWLGRDITISANIYHRGPYVDSTATTNRSITAGVDMPQRPTVFGYSTNDPFDAPGYTLADLRLSWQEVGDSKLSLSAAVTNVSNKIYRLSSASAFQITGAVYSLVGEPRMWFAQATYDF